MKKQCFYNANGMITRIVCSGKGQDLTDDEVGFFDLLIDSLVSDISHYVSNGELKSIPAGNSHSHDFDHKSGEWVANVERVKATAVSERNQMLMESDWTQLPDVPESTRSAWVEYRQALRDITDQHGFPDSILWPVKP